MPGRCHRSEFLPLDCPLYGDPNDLGLKIGDQVDVDGSGAALGRAGECLHLLLLVVRQHLAEVDSLRDFARGDEMPSEQRSVEGRLAEPNLHEHPVEN